VVNSEEMRCSFSYNTHLMTDAAKTNKKTAKQSLEELAKANPPCADKNINGWSYKYCFGNQITQFLSNIEYSLGHYTGFDEAKNQHKYEGGTPCDNAGPRTSVVSFACGQRIEILSVEEPEMCHYLFVVAFPQLCDNPIFQSVTIGNERLWFLEIVKQYDSTVTCSAQYSAINLEQSTGPLMNQFSLGFVGDTQITSYKARYANRRSFASDELTSSANTISSVDLEETPRFVSITAG